MIIAAESRTRLGPTISRANAPLAITLTSLPGFFISLLPSSFSKPSSASEAPRVKAPAAATIAATVPATIATVFKSSPKASITVCDILTIAAPNSTRAGPNSTIAAICFSISVLLFGAVSVNSLFSFLFSAS